MRTELSYALISKQELISKTFQDYRRKNTGTTDYWSFGFRKVDYSIPDIQETIAVRTRAEQAARDPNYHSTD
jgi:hypothetical protein